MANQQGVVSTHAKEPAVLAAMLLIVTITAALYVQVKDHRFINYDDNLYVTENEHVLGGLTARNIAWAFGIHGPGQWHPLTWLTHQLDCQLYGQYAGGHLLTNVAVHLANVVLLFLVLTKMTGTSWPSVYVAALFALHPLNVESVAWVSERRDVLSTMFWMLTLLAYNGYVRSGGAGRYGLVALMLALGLMAKPMLVTLPCVLLLLDYWPLGRFRIGQQLPPPARSVPPRSARFLLAEKVPLLLLCGVSSLLTILCQFEAKAVASLTAYPFWVRVANGAISYVEYLRKMIRPTDLAVFYPDQPIDHRHVIAAVVLLFVITFLALRWAHTRPYLPVGWFWYLGTLVPVIGIVKVGMAVRCDRYCYLPLIGIYLAAAWGARGLIARTRLGDRLLWLAACCSVAACVTYTWVQIGYWYNDFTLYEHALEVTRDNWMVHGNLGYAYYHAGDLEQGEEHLRECLRLHPRDTPMLLTLGELLEDKGDRRAAVAYYRQAHRLLPDFQPITDRLAWLLATSLDDSLRNGAEALALARRNAEAVNYRNAYWLETLSAAYAEVGDFANAVSTARRAQQLAIETGRFQLADRLAEERLAFYQQGRPLRVW